MQLDATPIHDPPIHNPNPLRLGEHYESDEDDDDDVPEHHSKADNSQKEHAGPSPSSALASLLEIDVSPFGPDIDPIFRDFYEKKLAPPPDSKAYDKLKTLKESYPPPGNMPYLRAPELNKIFQTKIKSYSVKAVEKHLSDAQNLIGVAMNISLTSISKQFKDGKLENADDILKQSPQIDSLRALAWTQRSISNARRRVLKVILSSQGQEALSGETSLLETQLKGLMADHANTLSGPISGKGCYHYVSFLWLGARDIRAVADHAKWSFRRRECTPGEEEKR